MMSIVGQDRGRFFVEPLDDAAFPLPARRLEPDPVAGVEPGHERRAPCLGNQLQALDDQAIEKTQVLLAKLSNRLSSIISVFQRTVFVRHDSTRHTSGVFEITICDLKHPISTLFLREAECRPRRIPVPLLFRDFLRDEVSNLAGGVAHSAGLETFELVGGYEHHGLLDSVGGFFFA